MFISHCSNINSDKNLNIGGILIIDYGYLKPNNQNTLQSVFKHKKNYLLKNLGKADVTSHVNFALLKEFFLKNNLKLKYISFAFLALACLVRYEGIVLILPLSFLFIFENRRNKVIIPKFLLCISIFLLVLMPMLLVRMDTIGYDGVFSHSVSAVEAYSSGSKIVDGDMAVFSFVKATALAVFPIFFIFLPLGIYGFFRRRSFDKYVILSFLIYY